MVSLLCGEGVSHNTTFESFRGGLVFVVEVGGFLVFFCGGGWTWHIVWQWY